MLLMIRQMALMTTLMLTIASLTGCKSNPTSPVLTASPVPRSTTPNASTPVTAFSAPVLRATLSRTSKPVIYAKTVQAGSSGASVTTLTFDPPSGSANIQYTLTTPVNIYQATGACVPGVTPANATRVQTAVSGTVLVPVTPGTYCFYEESNQSGTLGPAGGFITANILKASASSKMNIVMTKTSSKNTQVAISVVPRSGSGATPTGTVYFFKAGESDFSESLTNGAVAVQMPTAELKLYTWVMTYGGNATYSASSYTVKPANVPQ